MPTAEDIRAQPAYLPAGSCDGRAQFRQVFCTLAGQKQTPPGIAPIGCDDYLWRLQDEAAAIPLPAPRIDRARLRVFIVGGAFSDCFGAASLAYRTGIEHLQAAGYDVHPIPISGRSSSAANADLLAAGLEQYSLEESETVILLGHSKGTVDILQYLQDYPQGAAKVDAVISVAAPVWGSQIAESGAWAYDTLLAQAFSGRCDPGDGGAVDSLLPATRLQQMSDHPPPANIRYYSLMAFTTREHMSRGLLPSWRILASGEPRNDGQVTIAEGMLPGSTLLGYANADHWAVAIDIEEEMPFVAGRKNKQHYPRDALLEAMIRYVSADLLDSGITADQQCVTRGEE